MLFAGLMLARSEPTASTLTQLLQEVERAHAAEAAARQQAANAVAQRQLISDASLHARERPQVPACAVREGRIEAHDEDVRRFNARSWRRR